MSPLARQATRPVAKRAAVKIQVRPDARARLSHASVCVAEARGSARKRGSNNETRQRYVTTDIANRPFSLNPGDPSQAFKNDASDAPSMPVTLAVSAAAAIALGAGVPPALATDRILSPDEPGYLKDLRNNPAKYEAYAAAQEAIKNIPKAAPAVTVKETATTKAPKAPKAAPAPKAPKVEKKPAAAKPPSLQPAPSKPAAPAPAKEKKASYSSGNADVVKKTGGLSVNVLAGSVAAFLFFNSTKDETFSPDTSKPKAVMPKAGSDPAANAASAQGWIDAWSKNAPSQDKEEEASTYAAEAAEANAKAAQAWIDAWVSNGSSEAEIEQSAKYAAEAAAARAAEAQAWIDAWAAQASFSATAASVEEAKEWIEDWEKKGKPTDEAEKEEAKGFLKKLFGGFGKKN